MVKVRIKDSLVHFLFHNLIFFASLYQAVLSSQTNSHFLCTNYTSKPVFNQQLSLGESAGRVFEFLTFQCLFFFGLFFSSHISICISYGFTGLCYSSSLVSIFDSISNGELSFPWNPLPIMVAQQE